MPPLKSPPRPALTLADEPTWKPSRVTLTTDRGPVEVEAKALGALAIHDGLQSLTGKRVVTHVPTGLFLAAVATDADAERLGETAWGQCCTAMRAKTPDDVAAAIPQWALDWVFACREAAAYLDPEPYRARVKR